MNTQEVTIYRNCNDLYLAGIKSLNNDSMVVAPIHLFSELHQKDEAVLLAPDEGDGANPGFEIYVELWNKFISANDVLTPVFNATVKSRALEDVNMSLDSSTELFRTTEKLNADIAYQESMKQIFKTSGIW